MRIISCFSTFFLISTVLVAQKTEHLTAKVKDGDGLITFFSRYQISKNDCVEDYFRILNELAEDQSLLKDKEYHLPILVVQHDGKSIRSSIGINDWDLARKIEKYNRDMLNSGLREQDFLEDQQLWVPYNYLNCDDVQIVSDGSTHLDVSIPEKPERVYTFPIFGEEHKHVTIKDSKLKGAVFYVVSGHGGPDPGAMDQFKNETLCEDEYAYDVTLRLAKNLLEHDATVYVITRDDDDGIRDGEILPCDKDETCWKDKKIPRNQVRRLNQRADAINKLYAKNKKAGYKKQLAIVLHVDSRNNRDEQIDMFFYHKYKHDKGKKIANTLMKTIGDKYDHYQKNRGYNGLVKTRELYMLRKCKPTSIFIELGNIRNKKDQKRVVIEQNRQAVADWLKDGVLDIELSEF
ncbi:N-acetylmuramoyl-L-alanine amidase [Fulvivirgaceae bacterium BMA10]|uniref:N-acetylmuramoyl-L-alanine amidase n=1 Tax=Splendidivirga corallicola TaxID=3051826 RepID=A0ABT8KUI9_9BACT|nr:N-acetylmuramoyl-L-alanine amidase [Fulvivirgaceae bacterium BMA10]